MLLDMPGNSGQHREQHCSVPIYTTPTHSSITSLWPRSIDYRPVLFANRSIRTFSAKRSQVPKKCDPNKHANCAVIPFGQHVCAVQVPEAPGPYSLLPSLGVPQKKKRNRAKSRQSLAPKPVSSYQLPECPVPTPLEATKSSRRGDNRNYRIKRVAVEDK